MAEITFGGNFFIGGKSAALNPFSTVSQASRYPSISLFTPIFLPAGPFPCAEMVCECALGLSPGPPLPDGPGLGFLGCQSMMDMVWDGRVCSKS